MDLIPNSDLNLYEVLKIGNGNYIWEKSLSSSALERLEYSTLRRLDKNLLERSDAATSAMECTEVRRYSRWRQLMRARSISTRAEGRKS